MGSAWPEKRFHGLPNQQQTPCPQSPLGQCGQAGEALWPRPQPVAGTPTASFCKAKNEFGYLCCLQHVVKRYSLFLFFLISRLLGETLCRGRSPETDTQCRLVVGGTVWPPWGPIDGFGCARVGWPWGDLRSWSCSLPRAPRFVDNLGFYSCF